MKRLEIDLDSVITAFEHHEPESRFYLDRESGEILLLLGPYADPDEETRERIEADPERYIPIDPVPSSVGYQIMQDFIDSLPSGEAKEQLGHAIEGTRPFRRFKNVLYDYPAVREAWFRYHERALTQLGQKWLEDMGIEATLTKSRRDSET